MKITPSLRTLFASALLSILLLSNCVLYVYARSSPRRSYAERTRNNNITTDDTVVIVGDCDMIKPFFDSKNITLVLSKEITSEDSSKTTCGGKCCSGEMEERLKHQARVDFHNLIHHHSRSLQGLLATTADALRDMVTVLARQSENKTLTIFDQVYRSMAVFSKPSIRALYQAMVDYVSPSNTPDNLRQPLTMEMLQERFIDFFTKLFPIAYHYTINPRQNQQDFTDKFKTCLYETMNDIQPFGDIPQQISKSVSKSLEATRVLVQALSLGKTVLDKTDSVLFASTNSPQQEACYNALLRMTYCPRCKGISSIVRPCSGFCTNVMRGCLTEPASELDLAWSGYVEAVERLVVAVDSRNDPLGLNAEKAVRQLDARISDAIMHAMENGPVLEEKVRKVCGRAELVPSSGEEKKSQVSSSFSEHTTAVTKSTVSFGSLIHAAASPPHSTVHHRAMPTQLHVQLGNFLASVVRSRIFYGTLADAICEEYPDKHCWNGERVGEYTKTVVDSSLTAQRYNPEFTITTMSSASSSSSSLPSSSSPSKPTSYSNTNTSAIIDQLRHINQIVQSQLTSTPDFLGDEALDGSGSGDTPIWRQHANGGIDDDEDDQHGDQHYDDDEASGSGMGPITTDPSLNTHHNDRIGGSSTILLSSVAFAIACVSLLIA